MAAERTVVVGVDGSPASVEALRRALRQATATDAAIEAICAWQPPSMAELTPPAGIPAVVHQPVDDATALASERRRLDEVIESARVTRPTYWSRPPIGLSCWWWARAGTALS
jgi:hypothetical protein